jgi:hypothetical protein
MASVVFLSWLDALAYLFALQLVAYIPFTSIDVEIYSLIQSTYNLDFQQVMGPGIVSAAKPDLLRWQKRNGL